MIAKLLIFFLLVALVVGMIAAVHIVTAPSCTRGTIGCTPGLVSTLKAMPTYTPGPTPTMVPCHWVGSFCEPGIEIPPKIEPGHLRPVGPGYPFDVHA
jgi:hypothetical protein